MTKAHSSGSGRTQGERALDETWGAGHLNARPELAEGLVIKHHITGNGLHLNVVNIVVVIKSMDWQFDSIAPNSVVTGKSSRVQWWQVPVGSIQFHGCSLTAKFIDGITQQFFVMAASGRIQDKPGHMTILLQQQQEEVARGDLPLHQVGIKPEVPVERARIPGSLTQRHEEGKQGHPDMEGQAPGSRKPRTQSLKMK
ncbi:hypothetical protein BDV93DRAFT_515272 [Ceratobasidium sp. AG-I]|nr:hypothetical protein BDV93DRAFT_515272 [Ceratobasidium sp. AG-I]